MGLSLAPSAHLLISGAPSSFGAGLMAGIVFNFDDVPVQAKRLDALCQERGLLVRMLGVGTCVLSPSLVITEEEIDTLVSKLKGSVLLVAAEMAL